MKNVKFSYQFDGKRVVTKTNSTFPRTYGSHEYLIVGDLAEEQPKNEVVIFMEGDSGNGKINNNITIPVCKPQAMPLLKNGQMELEKIFCFPVLPIPQIKWIRSPAEEFTEKLYAFKRINYLLKTEDNCTRALKPVIIEDEGYDYNTYDNDSNEDNSEEQENNDLCKNEALRLALKFNFVTPLTSLVVENEAEYQEVNTKNQENTGNNPEFVPFGSSVLRSATRHSFNPGNPGFGGFVNNRKMMASIPISSNSHSNRRTTTIGTTTTTRPYVYRQHAQMPSVPSTGHSAFDTSDTNVEYGAEDDSFHSMTSYDSYDYYDSFVSSGVQNSYIPPKTTTTPSTTVCKVTLFSMTYFRGDSIELLGDERSLKSLNFDDKVASIRIEGNCCWKIYNYPNFRGRKMRLDEGEYESATDIKNIFKQASSVKIVRSC